MKYAVLIFPDKASQNIKKHLNPNIKTHQVNNKCVYAENIDKEIDADFFIFATTHSSRSKIPSLSVHSPGNFSTADLGGRPKTLPPCQAKILRQAFLTLTKLNQTSTYETILECTHHGPYLNKPAIFIEIGSTEKQWKDPQAGKIIAQVIEHLINTQPPQFQTTTSPPTIIQSLTAIGIGGLHTCPEFSKVLLRSNLSPGHICPKYQLENLDKEMLQQMINKTLPTPSLAILDWKGLGPHKNKIISLLKELNMPYKKTKDFHSIS